MRKTKQKANKPKRIFRKFFAIIAVIISLNIAIVYMNATPSNAEIDVTLPDEENNVQIQDTIPEFTDAVDCYLYAEALLAQSTYKSETKGYVKGYKFGNAWVHQTMTNYRYRANNGINYSTSVSLKQGSLGRDNFQKVYFNRQQENAPVYKILTDKKGSGTGDFSGVKWTAYTQEAYAQDNAGLPGTFVYIIRKSTVKKVETFERTADGGYHMLLSLDLVKSVKDYKRMVQLTAGSFADGSPIFSKVKAEIWIDKEGRFQRYIMDDEATISIMGIKCTMVSYYDEVFHVVGGDVQPPFQAPANA